MRPGVRLFMVILAALSVSACLREGPSPWPSERRILARGWVPRQVESKAPDVYCYRTLGTVDCHAQPIPADHNRRHDVTGASAKAPAEKPAAPDRAKGPAAQPATPDQPQDAAKSPKPLKPQDAADASN